VCKASAENPVNLYSTNIYTNSRLVCLTTNTILTGLSDEVNIFIKQVFYRNCAHKIHGITTQNLIINIFTASMHSNDIVQHQTFINTRTRRKNQM
jgi:hypothetical protein